MTRGWTAERRAAQAERARRLKPWTKSTGPRTAAGKAKVAGNALKTGLHAKAFRDEIREIRALLRANRTLVAEYRAMCRAWDAQQRREERAKAENKLKHAQDRDRSSRRAARRRWVPERILENKLKPRAPVSRSAERRPVSRQILENKLNRAARPSGARPTRHHTRDMWRTTGFMRAGGPRPKRRAGHTQTAVSWRNPQLSQRIRRSDHGPPRAGIGGA